jgi:hypothetical protein
MTWGREKIILAAVADTMLADEPGWTAASSREMAERADRFLRSCTGSMRWIVRLTLLAFEWGGLFLKTMDNRFEHFVRMPPRARRRYLRLWMNHRIPAIRDAAFLLKVMVYSFAYDPPGRARRFGFAPAWLR